MSCKLPKVQYVHLGGIATKILVYDPNNDEPGKSNHPINNNNPYFDFDQLILWFCGNPGPVDYYRQFLSNLHYETGFPVIGISNSGHDFVPPEIETIEITSENRERFGLESQIKYKIEFIRKFLKNDAKIFILAHSMGCYMTLEILDRCPDIQKMVIHSIMIFPTITWMLKTDSGRRLNTTITHFRFLIFALLYVLNSILSRANIIRLLGLFFWLTGRKDLPKHVVEPAANLADPKCLDATLTLVIDEFKQIDEPKLDIIKNNQNILSLFYGEADHWAPVEHYHYLKEKLQDQPGLDLRLCLGTMDHAFVMKPENVDRITQLCIDVIRKKFILNN